ncbi:MAG: TRAP transporter permease [Pseudomonadota bacterium]
MTKSTVTGKSTEQVAPRRRELKGWLDAYFLLSTTAGVLSSLYQLFHWGFLGTLMGSAYYYLLLVCFLPPVFLLYPARGRAESNKPPFYDLLFTGLALASSFYLCWHAEEIAAMGWEIYPPLEPLLTGAVLVVLILEAARRVGGPVFAGLCLFFTTFGLYSSHLPSLLQGMSYSPSRLAAYFSMGPSGIIGLPMRVVGNILIGYMIFAVALQITGGGRFFMDLSAALFGFVRGGSAKVAIFSSALFGSISGSAISNVLTTGAITIPTMKKAGYPPHYAGAIEACASTGGVLMPPVMGATAFVMAEFLGLPYVDICIAAVVPSFMYYAGLFLQADAYAARVGLKGIPQSQLPSLRDTVRNGWVYIAALSLLVWMLLYMRWDVWAPFVSATLLLLAGSLRRRDALRLPQWIGFVRGVGTVLAELAALLAAIGMIIGALSITGVAHSFSTEIIKLASGKIWLLLGLGAITSFILGMGMTITACYVFLAMVLAPALVRSGLNPLAVHLFIMYWGMASYITPPVALASFAGAGIAGADPMKTGFKSMQLGAVNYFVPFFFVLNPGLIFQGQPWEVAQAIVGCFVGMAVISASLEGWVLGLGKPPLWLRPLLFIAGLLLAAPETITDIVGISLLVLCLAAMWLLGRQPASAQGKEKSDAMAR